MKLSEIINFDGQGWPYGKLTERACELGGPVRFVNVVHWNGYESGYQRWGLPLAVGGPS